MVGGLSVSGIHDAAARVATTCPVYSATTRELREAVIAGSGLDEAHLEWLRELARAEDEDPVGAARFRALTNVRDAVAAAVEAELSSMTAAEAARFVSRHPSTIARWYRDGWIVGFKDAHGGLRLPRWQFTQQGLLPGTRQVAAAQGSLSLRALAAVMTTPADSLDGVAPTAWLASGRDPAAVVFVVSGANNW